ncbi:MAG: hypothetical protein QMC90_01010 [Dehalococcoidales bacterium]|nr:hypothetical protein [Dehalococcoidales bacterium]
MGVWHLAGLGLNPGAVTVPLTYVYLALKLASEGNEQAQDFFATSGEAGQQVGRGIPESLILFTSKEVIKGRAQNNIRDRWFNTRKKETGIETIKSYLTSLLQAMQSQNFSRFYNKTWLRYFLVVEVNHQDFEDCFFKISVTVNALRDKEIWINMIGGTNQINAALLSATGFITAAARNYYVFQTDTQLLHPDSERPDFNNLHLSIPPPSWHELPLFTIDMSRLYEHLTALFKGREKVNVKEIKNILSDLGFSEQFFPKLRGSLVKVEGEIATKGYMLEHWEEMWSNIGSELSGEANFTTWKKWATSKGILTKIEPF